MGKSAWLKGRAGSCFPSFPCFPLERQLSVQYPDISGSGFWNKPTPGCPWIVAMDSVEGDQEKQVQSYSGDPLIPAHLMGLLRLKLLLPYFLFSLS